MLEEQPTATAQPSHKTTSPASPGPGPEPSKTRRRKLPEGPVLASTKRALARWREIWHALQRQVPRDEWARMGFYSKAYGFWRVSSLLINNDNSVDVLMNMKVKCEDKLQVLNVLLLQDEKEKGKAKE